MIKFTVDLKVNGNYGMNKIYSGKHWSKRNADAEEIHDLVYYSMMQQNVPPVIFKKPVVIQMNYNSNLDIDNHGYLTKMIVDGLKGYLIKDDKRKYVNEIRQKFHDGKDVIVEIWEA
ncbi:MAG: hypothetical protein SA378_11490 [Sedimentibacter sp.]|uniref:hypothetical protein n=1 Tax=Sedimentibacter sp. TaxID=1960295 RepID=UPI0029817B57|nr:hypothetical protein [Sedimentibacter sp.]MDW5300738.1 hypothetical protein [Sedimentibacter sp.]